MSYKFYKEVIELETGVKLVGYLPPLWMIAILKADIWDW